MTSVKYSPEAINDLNQIGDYIENKLKNKDAAKRIVQDILNSVSLLENMPEMGVALSASFMKLDDFRYIVSGKYLVFYKYIYDEVYISRIIYEKRNYISILF